MYAAVLTILVNDVKPKQIHSHKQSNHWNDKFQQFINKYDPDNEEEEIKKLKAKQRCINLYNNGKEKLKNLQTIQQKNTELKVKREMDQCTFKPKLNKERKLCYVINKKENKEKVVRPSKAHSQDK